MTSISVVTGLCVKSTIVVFYTYSKSSLNEENESEKRKNGEKHQKVQRIIRNVEKMY